MTKDLLEDCENCLRLENKMSNFGEMSSTGGFCARGVWQQDRRDVMRVRKPGLL